MKWKPAINRHGNREQMALTSECGRYNVAKYGTAQGVRYEAWRNGSPPVHMAACMDSADAAKAVCEADLIREAADKRIQANRRAANVIHTAG